MTQSGHGLLPATKSDPVRYPALTGSAATKRRSEADDESNPQSLEGCPMARRNFPDLTFEVVQHDRSWAIWLVVILGGVVGVFALTALIVSLVHS